MGNVFLIGAGPGDPDLLTIKALRLLQRADVVLHDGLVSQAILDLVRPEALRVDIGKRCGCKLMTQAEINTLLIDYASKTDTVVRLKGGDPLVFGRAGEEIDALIEAGVQFEIVPGITTALAAAAAVKRSLTDRRVTSSVVLVTAHRGSEDEAVEWDHVVTSGSTLAIYMPGTHYAALASNLITAGLDMNTPCAVVSRATLADQRVLITTIGQLRDHDVLPAPAHVLVGRCLNPAEHINLIQPAFSGLASKSIQRSTE